MPLEPVTLWLPESARTNGNGTGREAQLYHQLETVAEAFGTSVADLQLLPDMMGFRRLGTGTNGMLDLSPAAREDLVKRSRIFWQHEPLADRTIAMWTETAFGRPWQFDVAKGSDAQIFFDEVLKARYNRAQFSRQAWRTHSDSLLVDGERWFAFFVGERTVRVRSFDPLEIKEVLTNPEDKDEVWYYRRTFTTLDENGQEVTRTVFYRDWDYIDENGNPGNAPHPLKKPNRVGAAALGEVDWEPQKDVWVTHLKINTLGQRGWPLLTSALDWIRAHREFMRDRSALSAARAQWFAQGNVKGGQQDVLRVASAFAGPNPVDPTEGSRDPRAGIAWHNDAVKLEQMAGNTDGAAAMNDQRALRAMAAMPSGIPDFLFGDTGASNLATATATARPLETMFSAYQDLWVEWLEDVVWHFATWRKRDPESMEIVIDPPSIMAKEPWLAAEGFSHLANAVPAVAAAPQPIAMLLTDMGVDDVEGAMEIIEPLLGMPAQDTDVEATMEAVRETVRMLKEAGSAA